MVVPIHALQWYRFADTVKKALEQGVIVKVEDQMIQTSEANDGIYRLSYMLYPYFHIVQSFTKNIIFLEELLTNISRE